VPRPGVALALVGLFVSCGAPQARTPREVGAEQPGTAEQGAPEPDFHGPMTPVQPSAMASELQAIGLNLGALPPLSKVDPKTVRALMKTFAKSLGARCIDCHDSHDFAAPTPMKAVARGMWNHFVLGLTTADGAPIYCDSCHQGRRRMLDRSDKKALAKWMQTEYLSKLSRSDRGEHSCATCHGDPFDGEIFKHVWHAQESVGIATDAAAAVTKT
jgi:hypothetical protein